MLYYFLALFSAAVIVMLNNRTNESNRWSAYFLCSASIGGLSDLFMRNELLVMAEILQFLNYTITPYGVFVFSLIYSGAMNSKQSKKKAKLFLAIPIVLMAGIVLITSNKQWFFSLLLVWSTPYYLISCYLLTASFWKEQDVRLKRSRFITTIIIVPTLLAVLFFIYVAKVVSPDFEFFNYISVFIIYSLAIALLCTFIYGVLGVKLRFEHDPLEGTMRAVSSGAMMLNHTIKNEIGKIAISTENLKNMLPESNQQSTQQMQIIMNASNHMLEMMNRIHSQLKDFTLKEAPVQLDRLIEQCLMQHEGLLKKQGISVTAVYELRPIVICDAVHISEALGNVLMNASEAMPVGGNITVRLEARKRGIELSVKDNGVGIQADRLGQVFEPFYSSGKTGRNFGLGLSYVYNVIHKSGAKVELDSREGLGTRVAFVWPRKKIL
ncbi:sensor histidine kinase [Paenibacillus sp. Soil522]|uniref:sensor histidine kinase n=1 Tax=Paenibacillus sp. Soil522 TaxID=1736388 RepID=UPI0006F54CD8|nr:sensor histidine kinase [Paenibacillus sp. Soil522]KRE25203.1 histidine kinase [Paenibacillus sp. Soil522]